MNLDADRAVSMSFGRLNEIHEKSLLCSFEGE